eukprot:TRINITY_DN17915_c0_g2_i1.p1 TRINITY_DN17915_c0_g2~~TRINITY_DN17915_c0_g2_i1.p1  ORF type:complete len:253 (-),score=85.31 TRINITY_DN17915_c0_g2_i1:139-855(-)
MGVDNQCGQCLAGYGMKSVGIDETDPVTFTLPCNLLSSRALSAVTTNALFNDNLGDKANDGNIYSHYVAKWAPYDNPSLVLTYPSSILLVRYDIVSASNNPTMDPMDWTLEGSVDQQTWVGLDQQRGVMWDARHQAKSFGCKKCTTKYPYYRFTFNNVRDPDNQGSTTINVDVSINQGNGVVNTTTSLGNSTQAFVTRVQLAEVSLYSDDSYKASAAMPNIVMALASMILSMAILLLL